MLPSAWFESRFVGAADTGNNERQEKGNDMFTRAKAELKELVALVAEIERYDATLAAKRDIVPTEESRQERRRKEMRKLELLDKYELS
ncbi:hypothetical protein [Burkholderia sp. BCC0405]|uniref:hypothetical protein n=1 Tax=Burkholderia sp. BCC0405 TaxID=2676298 RepID=UPI00158A745E|nr:hypothetical protein [Burkholderia sp. BCC0405]